MKSLKYLVLLITLLGVALVTPATTLALQQPEYGGNNSADYQPPTRNPQGDTATGLQPNSNTSLQPAPVGINPQNLIQAGGLTVLTSKDKGASSTASQPPAPKKSRNTLPTWIIGGTLTLAAAIYVVRSTDKKKVSSQPKPIIAQPAIVKKPSKTKPVGKKTTRKKRQAAKSKSE